MKSPLTERPDRRRIKEEKNKLALKDAQGKRPSNDNPTLLKIKSINTSTPLFQPRDSLIYEWASSDHVKQMAEVLERDPTKQRMLEPLTIMAFGSQWYLLDGHHRLQAYRDAGYEVVAVQAVHSDTRGIERVKEGQRIALRDNVRTKLPMMQTDRANAAWRLVASNEEMTAKEIEEITQVSERTIRSMRAVMRKIVETKGTEDLTSYSWSMARWEAEGRTQEEIDKKDRIEQEALYLAKRLKKNFREDLIRKPEVTLRALAIYDSRLPAILGIPPEPEATNEPKE